MDRRITLDGEVHAIKKNWRQWFFEEIVMEVNGSENLMCS